jgi:hypothetical protein
MCFGVLVQSAYGTLLSSESQFNQLVNLRHGAMRFDSHSLRPLLHELNQFGKGSLHMIDQFGFPFTMGHPKRMGQSRCIVNSLAAVLLLMCDQ